MERIGVGERGAGADDGGLGRGLHTGEGSGEVAHSFVINRTKILNPRGIVKTTFSFFPRRAVLQFVGGVEVALQGSVVFEIVFRGEESVEFGGGRFK